MSAFICGAVGHHRLRFQKRIETKENETTERPYIIVWPRLCDMTRIFGIEVRLNFKTTVSTKHSSNKVAEDQPKRKDLFLNNITEKFGEIFFVNYVRFNHEKAWVFNSRIKIILAKKFQFHFLKGSSFAHTHTRILFLTLFITLIYRYIYNSHTLTIHKGLFFNQVSTLVAFLLETFFIGTAYNGFPSTHVSFVRSRFFLSDQIPTNTYSVNIALALISST